ncbi:MAG: response regulator [Endomicrobiales bacterium]
MTAKGIKVLIVDDNQNILDVSAEGLGMDGFETMTAINGRTALFKIRENKPDIILLDVNLPDIDGFQICRQLRSDPKTSGVPVILMTGDRTIDIDKGFSVGADDCIIKPIDLEKLALTIEKLVKKKKKVLVLDDDRQICDMLRDVITKQQFDVEVLYDGKNVIEEVKRASPDLMLLDVSLEVAPDGVEICRMLKSDPATRGIPVIMLTANEFADAIEKCFSFGAEDYIFKPFNIPDLILKVDKYLRYGKKENA